MKYFLALLAGLASGALIFAFLLYLNPFVAASETSPLTVSSDRDFELNYTATPTSAIAWINDGDEIVEPKPTFVPLLREPAIVDTLIHVTTLNSSRGTFAGVGVKFTSPLEETGLLKGVYAMQSAWHIWLLDRGGMMINQSENHWLLLRDVALQAQLDSGDSWRGNWFGVLTDGPNKRRTGRVSRGYGRLVSDDGEAVETITAKAYSAETGPVAVEGRVTISLFPVE